jgi:hypothetical protein
LGQVAIAISKAAAPEEAAEHDLLEEAEQAKRVAVQALETRVALEGEAERAKLRSDEAVHAQLLAEEEARRTRVNANQADQARRATEEAAGRARLAAEDALQAWAATLAVEAPNREPFLPMLEPILEAEVQAAAFEVNSKPEAAEEPADVTCQIAYWRGYVKSAFYARAFDESGQEVALAESPRFRAQGKDLPDQTEQAVAAHEELTAQLANEGWEADGRDATWFGRTFRRRVS